MSAFGANFVAKISECGSFFFFFFFFLPFLSLTQHLQDSAIVSEEGTMKDFPTVKGWQEWANCSGW